MWAIRVLTGPQAGKTFLLKPGNNIVGRSPQCDIKLDSQGISKKHAEIFAFEDRVVINDAGSTNGIYVNGIRVNTHQIKPGDKLSLYNIIIAIVPSEVPIQPISQVNSAPSHEAENEPQPPSQSPKDFIAKAQDYFNNVVMPGLYKMVEVAELKMVLFFMLMVFIVIVTSLQVLPTISELKKDVLKEGIKRAITIAKNLKAVNEQAIISGNDAQLDVSVAKNEEGVKEALIVAADQRIKAPIEMANGIPTQPFILEALKKDSAFSKQIDDSLLGASLPIQAFNAETGTIRILAYAVVIYRITGRTVDSTTATQIFINNLLIAVVLGLVLYLFLFKLFEFPFVSLNEQIDQALKNNTASIQIAFQLEPLQKLCSNINAALSRSLSSAPSNPTVVIDRTSEAENIVEGIPGAALAIDGRNETIISVNRHYERLTGISGTSLRRQSLGSITDSALRQNIEDLISRFKVDNTSTPTGTLEFAGLTHELRLQAVMENDGAAYYLIFINPLGGT